MVRLASSLAAAALALQTPSSADAFSYTKMIRTCKFRSLLAFRPQEQYQQPQEQYQQSQEQYQQPQEQYQQPQGQYQLQDQYEQPHPAETGSLDRAVDCANNFGMCDIDEILDLSDELDAYMGCFVEDGPEACENEIGERKHLADALLMQGEMMGHQQQPQFGQEMMGQQQQTQFGQGGFYEEGPQGPFIEEGGYASYDQPMQNNFGSPVPPASSPPLVGTSGSVRNSDDGGVSNFLPQDFAMAPDSYRGSQSHVTTKGSHNGNF